MYTLIYTFFFSGRQMLKFHLCIIIPFPPIIDTLINTATQKNTQK